MPSLYLSSPLRRLPHTPQGSPRRQQDLDLIHARSTLVRARTMLVNALRGLVKSAGGRLGACSTRSFPDKTRASIPPELQPACTPLAEQIAQLNLAIAGMDRHRRGPREQVSGDPAAAHRARRGPDRRRLLRAHARPARRDRGQPPGGSVSRPASAPEPVGRLEPAAGVPGDRSSSLGWECGISKTGNTCLRSLLVQAAHDLLGRFGPDSALRRWGLGLAARGGKRGKKRAVVAVARKLAVLLHSMGRNRKPLPPFPQKLGAGPSRNRSLNPPPKHTGKEGRRQRLCGRRSHLAFG